MRFSHTSGPLEICKRKRMRWIFEVALGFVGNARAETINDYRFHAGRVRALRVMNPKTVEILEKSLGCTTPADAAFRRTSTNDDKHYPTLNVSITLSHLGMCNNAQKCGR
jgi:hypothetical protein